MCVWVNDSSCTSPFDNNNNNNNNNDNYECISSLNCHNMNLNNKTTMGTNASHNSHDGNNNTTIKIRKCCSINQIDLSLLKNELDEYIDRELRTTNFGRNTIAQRRCQFESNLKKVNLLIWPLHVLSCIFPNKFYSSTPPSPPNLKRISKSRSSIEMWIVLFFALEFDIFS